MPDPTQVTPSANFVAEPATPAQANGDSASSVAAILNAAERLISTAGYAGFSMRELAEASGLAKGTIYYYFRDKQDVYWRVVDRQMASLQEQMAAAATGHADPVQGLHAVIHTYFSLISQRRHSLMATLRDNKEVQMPLQGLIEKYRQGFMQPLADLVHRGIAQGLFHPVDVDMTVISLLGMMNAFVTHRLLLDQVDLDQSVADHTLALLMSGIAIKK